MIRRSISVIAAVMMMTVMIAGCGKGGTDQTQSTGLANTDKVDSAIKNASVMEDSSGFLYTGEGPITNEGGVIKIMAQKSNYTNVDITKAPIVLKVFEEAGVQPDWQLFDYDKYEAEAGPIIDSLDTDADIIKVPDNDPNQVYIKSGQRIPANIEAFGISR